jgi:hypothetical protein
MYRLPRDKRDRIAQLQEQGHTQREIAEEVGASRESVSSYSINGYRRTVFAVLREVMDVMTEKGLKPMEIRQLVDLYRFLGWSCPIHPEAISDVDIGPDIDCKLCVAAGLQRHHFRHKMAGDPIIPPHPPRRPASPALPRLPILPYEEPRLPSLPRAAVTAPLPPPPMPKPEPLIVRAPAPMPPPEPPKPKTEPPAVPKPVETPEPPPLPPPDPEPEVEELEADEDSVHDDSTAMRREIEQELQARSRVRPPKPIRIIPQVAPESPSHVKAVQQRRRAWRGAY